MKNVYCFWTGFYPNSEKEDCFDWASRKAYLDMNRTLRFIIKNNSGNKDDVVKERKQWLLDGTDVIRNSFNKKIKDFNLWHKEVCDELIDIYSGNKLKDCNGKETSLTYGQAQKWLNMTLKYLWLLNRLELLEGNTKSFICKYQDFFHIPLDSYILRYIARKNKNKDHKFVGIDNGLGDEDFSEYWNSFGSVWSAINDYDKYLEYQKKISKITKAKGQYPLEWELEHWHKAIEFYNNNSDSKI